MRLLAAFLVVALIWASGLLAFAGRVDRSTPAPEPPSADGLVALTGGSDERIAKALELLKAGKARRLLISGVGPHVTRAQLQAITGVDRRLFACCVDLGFTAANTIGNGRETAKWARAKGYRRLILVTADYHMPRARLELRAAMPEAEITSYPVPTPALSAHRWWRTSESAERMALEYCKYLAVLARQTAKSLTGAPDHG